LFFGVDFGFTKVGSGGIVRTIFLIKRVYPDIWVCYDWGM